MNQEDFSKQITKDEVWKMWPSKCVNLWLLLSLYQNVFSCTHTHTHRKCESKCKSMFSQVSLYQFHSLSFTFTSSFPFLPGYLSLFLSFQAKKVKKTKKPLKILRFLNEQEMRSQLLSCIVSKSFLLSGNSRKRRKQRESHIFLFPPPPTHHSFSTFS